MGLNKGIRQLALAMALVCLPWSTALAAAEIAPTASLETTEESGAGEGEPGAPVETPGEATPTPVPVETRDPATPSPAPMATPAPSPSPSLTPSPLPTATVPPPASPTPAPSITPTPLATPTPSISPTPTPLPSPTPTPAYGVILQGEDARVQLGQGLDLAGGVTARDEKGAALKVTVVG